MKRITLLPVSILLVAGTLCPQGERPAAKLTGDQLLGVINRLKSYDLAQVAWGAHLVAEHDLKRLVPALCDTLRRLQGHDPRDARVAAMALLDAMIRLDAEVPSKDLKPWLSNFTLPAALVLMAPKPKRYEARLLEIYDRCKTEDRNARYWCAAGNLLVSIKSKKVAARLLDGLAVSVSINVYDDDSNKDVRRNPDPWRGGAYDGPLLEVPKSYPPVPLYCVEKRERAPESKLLATGAQPIYYRRTLSRRYRIAATWVAEKPKRNLEWICDLLDIEVENQPFQLWTTARHVWRDEASYFRKVETEKLKVVGSFRSLIHRLQGRGLVTRDEVASVQPRLNIYVFDHRRKHMTPLPEIDAVKVEAVKTAGKG